MVTGGTIKISEAQVASKREQVRHMLAPRSVAIVGASPTPGALGASVLSNLERNGFGGEIHLINPKRDQINGRPCLRAISELPDGVDVAVLAIPQATVLQSVRALAERKVGAAVIFSAGFAEAGQEGLAQQREIAHIAQQAGMLVEGPNCLGFINYLDRVALTFIEAPISIEQAERNRTQPAIGVLSQSGAMMTVLNTTLTSRDLPLSYAVSTGNEAASHLEDYAEFLLDDPSTQVIAMIAEQFRQPHRLLAVAERARTKGKQIVLLHPGRSSAARESATTHTGAMAGDYQVMRTKVEHAGIVMAHTLEELGDIAEIMLRSPPLQAGGTAVLGESGAFKALVLDLCEELQLPLPALRDDDSPALRAAMPEFVAVSNPLDLTAQGLVDPELFERTVTALLSDQRFSSVVIGLIQTDPVTCNIKVPPVLRAVAAHATSKPVICAGLDEGAEVPPEYITQMRALGMNYFPSTERALRALKRLQKRAERDFTRTTHVSHAFALGDVAGVVPEYRAKELLSALRVPFSSGALATTLEEAITIAQRIGWPVALKAQSAALSHKSDAGGVALGLTGPETLEAAWVRMHADLAIHDPTLRLDGILVEAMGARGLEMIVGARNDAQWGPVILVGFGGVTAEVIRDVVLLAPDLPKTQVAKELDRLKGAALLHGFRGTAPLDVEALAELVVNLGTALLAEPRITEVDLNPVVVYPQGQGVIALDALMLVEPASQARTPQSIALTA